MKKQGLLLLFLFNISILFSITYKVGIYDNPPLCFLDNGEAKGFYIDVLNDIAEDNSFDFQYELFTFKEAHDLLIEGKLDLVVAMGKTPEREHVIDFNTKPFMSSWAEVYTRSENSFNTFVDLQNKSVGLLKNGLFGQRFVDDMKLYNLTFSAVYYDSYIEILEDIEDKELDAGVVNRFSKNFWKPSNSLGETFITFSPIEVFAGFNQTVSDELIPVIDGYLTKMRADEGSIYYEYIRQWLSYTQKSEVKYLYYVILCLLILAVILALYFIFRLIEKLNKKVIEFKALSEDFKTVLHSIGDAVIWTDIEGNVQGMNPLACELTAWESEEAKGCKLDEIVVLRDYFSKAERKIPLDEIIRKKEIYNVSEDTELVSRDKKGIIISDSIAPILNESGEITGIVFVFRDITEKRKNEIELADSENRFRAFMDSFPAIIFIKDTDYRTVYINRFVKEHYVDDPNEWVGKTAVEIFGDEIGGKMMEGDFETMNASLKISEESILNKFGEWRQIKTYKFPIEKKYGRKYLGGFSLDVTQFNNTMSELELSKKEAEKANDMKDIFLANINHEIRTPLNGIKGILHLFDRKGLSKDQMDYINMLEYSADRLKRLVDDILDFSKLNLDRIKLEKRPVKLDELCKVLHSEYRKRAEEKELTFTCKYLSPEINDIMMDPLRFEQILHNLLSNSLKFTDNGSVSLVGEYIPMDSKSGILKIEIADTGIGMSEDTVEKIFDYFYQGDQSYTKKFQGTGIGMALVKRLLDLMEGEIHIDSTPGKGTKYRLTVPVDLDKSVSEIKKTGNEELKDIYRGQKFLIVEDDKINRLIMKKALEKTGANILQAENGRNALKTIFDQKPDLVFMDIQMPDISGVDVIKEIRGSGDEYNDIKIIAVSGYSQEKEITAFLEAGADDFISKPVENKALFEMIFKHISG